MKVRLSVNGSIVTNMYGRPVEPDIQEARRIIKQWQEACSIDDCVDVLILTKGNNVLTLTATEFMQSSKHENVPIRKYSYDGTEIDDLTCFVKNMKLCKQEAQEINSLDRGQWMEIFGKPLIREK